MTTALLTHPDCLRHVTPPGHPERVARLEAVLAALEGMDLARHDAPEATDEALLRVHPRAYLDAVAAAEPQDGWVSLDPDTHMSPGSAAAARRAAGACIAAVDLVIGGGAANAFCAVRPPGHHAEAQHPMGFCLFGNVAAAAMHALAEHGLERVAIVDFDVHHGNGTQALVEREPRILFASTHQMPLYPGTGAPSDHGPHGSVLNVALSDGDGGAAFRAAMEGAVLPAVDAFAPDLLLISAGFDAHRADPLATLRLETDDFAWVTDRLCALADRHCGGRVVSTLEGGYDLEALAESATAHVAVLKEWGG